MLEDDGPIKEGGGISLRIFCVELQLDVILITSWFIVT